jgi:hypothetical protein
LSYMLPIDQEAELRAIPSASVRCGDTHKAFDNDHAERER